MIEEPHYIVVEGTNQRWTTTEGLRVYPIIYDTQGIAQNAIDEHRDSQTSMDIPTKKVFKPIAITEYNRKYVKILQTEV